MLDSDPQKLISKHENLVHSELQKVVSHVQRDDGDWIINTVMIEGHQVPFRYKRKKKASRKKQTTKIKARLKTSAEQVTTLQESVSALQKGMDEKNQASEKRDEQRNEHKKELRAEIDELKQKTSTLRAQAKKMPQNSPERLKAANAYDEMVKKGRQLQAELKELNRRPGI